MKKNRINIVFIISAMLLGIVTIGYGIVWDLFLIGIVFLSAYCIGQFISVDGDNTTRVLVSTACGLGVIGVLIYFILLFGIGCKTSYIIILGLPILLKYLRKSEKNKIEIEPQKLEAALIIVFSIFLVAYLIYGSSPIDKFDSYTKHLPITMYAAETGSWYTNVVESVVYTEGMVLQYTFSTVFLVFGAQKALTLFNVILFFIIFIMIVKIGKLIYSKINVLLLMLLFFTVPMFFEFATCFYLEMLPLFFLFAAILCFAHLNKKESWNNLEVVAWLFGCAVFSKLTISYTVLVVGIIELALCIRYYIINKKKNIFLKFLRSAIIFVIPFGTSVMHTWYKLGNPLFPFFNGIFKSPYFNTENFIDPFNQSPLGINIKSLINIVFHTSKNVEMVDGGLGIFLLLVFLIPILCLIKRKKNIIVWSIVPFVAFSISCIFTYNLRYSMAIYMLFMIMIIIAITVIFEKCIERSKIIEVLIIILLMTPNVIYIYKNYNISEKIKVDQQLSKAMNQTVLQEIPDDKKVYSVNEPFKGEYKGFFSSHIWHNTFMLNEIKKGNITLEDYIKSFDYVLYNKQMSIDNKELEKIVQNAGEIESFLIPYKETDIYILYKVKEVPKTKLIYEEKFDEAVLSNVEKPITHRIENTMQLYNIEQDIENKYKRDIQVRFQINWFDKNDKFLDAYINVIDVKPGRSKYNQVRIPSSGKAKYGVVYITTHTIDNMLIHAYKITGISKETTCLDKYIKMYETRELLESH